MSGGVGPGRWFPRRGYGQVRTDFQTARNELFNVFVAHGSASTFAAATPGRFVSRWVPATPSVDPGTFQSSLFLAENELDSHGDVSSEIDDFAECQPTPMASLLSRSR